MRDHPFKGTPQYDQQYGSLGDGYEGNGLGRVGGVDPHLWSKEHDHFRRSSMKNAGLIHYEDLEPHGSYADTFDRAGLTEKQRFVLELRLGIRDGRTHTLQEIASLMGVRHQSVSELEQAAKRKLERVLFE